MHHRPAVRLHRHCIFRVIHPLTRSRTLLCDGDLRQHHSFTTTFQSLAYCLLNIAQLFQYETVSDHIQCSHFPRESSLVLTIFTCPLKSRAFATRLRQGNMVILSYLDSQVFSGPCPNSSLAQHPADNRHGVR